MKFGCSIGIFLNSAHLICRSTDISKCFRGSLRLRDNESRLYLISKACVLFSSSAAKVHDSQAYRNMDMTRKRISFTFDPRDMLLSLHIGLRFVRAVVACAIRERTSGFEPSSETIATMYLKLVTVRSYSPLTVISLWMSLALLIISFVFFCTYLHFIACAGLVEIFN